MNEEELQRVFRAALNSTLLLAAASCGGGNEASGTASGGSGKGAVENTCDNLEELQRLHHSNLRTAPFWPDLPEADYHSPLCDGYRFRAAAGHNPPVPVDYVAVHHNCESVSDGELHFYERDASGTPCGTATDPAVCLEALQTAAEHQPRTDSYPESGLECGSFLITTSGDEVRIHASEPERLEYLGDINTPQEALLVFGLTIHQGFLGCGEYNNNRVRTVPDGFEIVANRMQDSCHQVYHRELFHVAKDGTVTPLRCQIASLSSGCVGRRPEGLVVSKALASGNAVGDFFSEVAHLEAASVPAFQRLHEELAAHGAPEELLDTALVAADDEVRHAKLTAQLAQRFGGSVRTPSVATLPVRSLVELACENAAEGCVRETFGALFGHYQAATAGDPEIRRIMHTIAEDETRHAALAWRVAAWALQQLPVAGREKVKDAQRSAIATLREELAISAPPDLRAVAGVPDRAAAHHLLAQLEAALWLNSPNQSPS